MTAPSCPHSTKELPEQEKLLPLGMPQRRHGGGQSRRLLRAGQVSCAAWMETQGQVPALHPGAGGETQPSREKRRMVFRSGVLLPADFTLHPCPPATPSHHPSLELPSHPPFHGRYVSPSVEEKGSLHFSPVPPWRWGRTTPSGL